MPTPIWSVAVLVLVFATRLAFAQGDGAGGLLKDTTPDQPRPIANAKPAEENRRQYDHTISGDRWQEVERQVHQEELGLLGHLKAIEIRGAKSFTPDEIRRALAKDLEYQAAARPSSSLVDYVDVLKDRVEQGYAYAGIGLDVEVSIGKKIEVTVDEKSSKIFGEFVIAGDKEATPGLLERIRGVADRRWSYNGGSIAAGASRPAWVSGGPFRCDDVSLGNTTDHFIACFAEQGLMFSADCFAFEAGKGGASTAEVVDCVLDASKARELRIGRIDIKGLRRHTRQEILGLVEIKEGDPLRGAALETACKRLEESLRFWSHSVDVQLPMKPDRYGQGGTDVRVVIRLVEYDKAPELGEPLTEQELVASKAASWLGDLEDCLHDLVVDSYHSTCSGSFFFSPQKQRCLLNLRGAIDVHQGFRVQLNHTAIVEPHGFTLIDWRLGEKLTAPRNLALQLDGKVAPSFDKKGEPDTHFKLGLGWSAESDPALCRLRVAPVTMLRPIKASETQSLENGVLTLTHEEFEARVDAKTGRLLNADIESEEVGNYSIRTEAGAFEREAVKASSESAGLPEMFDRRRGLASIAAFASRQLAAQLSVQRDPQLAQSGRALQEVLELPMVVSLLEKLASTWSITSEGKDGKEAGFAIPVDVEVETRWEDFDGELKEPLLVYADTAFKRGSWPWTLMREFTLLEHQRALKDTEPCEREFQRLCPSDKTGPLGLLVIALELKRNQVPVFTWYANQGLQRLDNQAFRRDVQQLTSGEVWDSELAQTLFQAASRLNKHEQGLLLSLAPRAVKEPIRCLLQRRATLPLEPARDAVAAALLEAWGNGWREELRSQLDTLAHGDKPL